MSNINITKIDTGFVIENNFGKLELSWKDFYNLVRFSDHNDTLTEIEEYVTQFDVESSVETFGKDVVAIISDKELMDKIAKRLVKNRIESESTDDIYNAIRDIC